MTEDLFFVLVLLTLPIILLIGAICGIVALIKVQSLRMELAALRAQLHGSSASGSSKDRAAPEVKSAKPGEVSPSPPRPVSNPAAGGQARSGLSLEMLLGTRWMARLGMVMFLVGLAFLLRFAYEHHLIGELGRLAIGCLAGAVALGAGEYMRRSRHFLYLRLLRV